MKSKEFLKIANRFRDGFAKGLKNAFHIHRPSEYKNQACQESGMYESWKKRLKTAVVYAAIKPEPLSHLTNNWKKMHGLPMRRRTLQERKRKNVSNGIRRNHRGTKKK